MIRHPLPWMVGFLSPVIALAAPGLYASDTSPEEVLTSHGLKRSAGSATYVLPAEADVQRKLSRSGSARGQLGRALSLQRALERRIQGLKADRAQLSRQFSQVNAQLKAEVSPPARAQLTIENNRLVGELQAITD